MLLTQNMNYLQVLEEKYPGRPELLNHLKNLVAKGSKGDCQLFQEVFMGSFDARQWPVALVDPANRIFDLKAADGSLVRDRLGKLTAKYHLSNYCRLLQTVINEQTPLVEGRKPGRLLDHLDLHAMQTRVYELVTMSMEKPEKHPLVAWLVKKLSGAKEARASLPASGEQAAPAQEPDDS